MKRKNVIQILILLTFLSNLLFAQSPLNKGIFNLSGGLSYSSTSVDEDDYDSKADILSITPGIYYFVVNNFAIGGTFLYQKISSEYNNEYDSDWGYSTIGFGPGARYYLNLGEIKPFVSISYSFTSSKDDDSEDDDTHKTTDIAIGGGFDYFISKNISIEPYARYHILGSKYGDEEGPDRKMLEIGIGIGVFVFWRTNKHFRNFMPNKFNESFAPDAISIK